MTDAAPLDIHALRRAVLAWYADHRRALPWRRSSDPYAVWISEVMLQQTRAATVRPYFLRWMARFPDVAALAAATEEAVLTAWQGLGYYGRARNAHRAAQAVVASHGGRLPASWDDLVALPGIGAYTAGAVASIAFGARVPAVDGNVRRVLGRVLAVDADVTRGPGAARVTEAAARLADGPSPGDLNQGLMELGATVCAPRRPACHRCPAAPWCAARATGDPAAYPPRRPRPQPRAAQAVAWLITDPAGRVLVARRAPNGLLGGLWEFPITPITPLTPLPPLAGADDALGATVRVGEPLTHVFTHLALTVTPVRAAASRPFVPDAAIDPYVEWRWVDRPAIDALPVSTLMRKLTARFDGAI